MLHLKALVVFGAVSTLQFLPEYFQTSTIYIIVRNLTYKGGLSRSGQVATFYGIPYAHPPLGELRFRAPVPLDWGKNASQPVRVVDGRKLPAFCIQGTMFPSDTERGGAGSEDCLHLNIYLPAGHAKSLASSPTLQKASQLLPVMVYIHGGGFLGGNPLSWPFEHWIEQSPDLVIVSIYYRLNLFGFLTTPSEGDTKEGTDYNVGILDQIEALKWVQKNIATFGGDPKRVTISGHSAGAASVFLLMVANEGKQELFHQAIAQSVYRPAMRLIEESKDHFEWVVRRAGCSIEGTSRMQQIGCLRSKETVTLVSATESAQLHNWSWQFRPVIDNQLFKDYPTSLLNAGKVSAVPLLVGATSNETFVTEGKLEPDLRRWYPHLTDDEMGHIVRIYDSYQFSSELERAKVAVGETLNQCGRDVLSSALSKARVPVYAYRFDERDPTQPEEDGVQHSAENYFMFRGVMTGSNGTFSFAPPETVPSAFTRELISAWTSFVRSGNPNTHRINTMPHWPQWETRHIWGLWKSGPWRMLLQQSSRNSTNQRGSMQERVPSKELERCLAMGNLANMLHH